MKMKNPQLVIDVLTDKIEQIEGQLRKAECEKQDALDDIILREGFFLRFFCMQDNTKETQKLVDYIKKEIEPENYNNRKKYTIPLKSILENLEYIQDSIPENELPDLDDLIAEIEGRITSK